MSASISAFTLSMLSNALFRDSRGTSPGSSSYSDFLARPAAATEVLSTAVDTKTCSSKRRRSSPTMWACGPSFGVSRDQETDPILFQSRAVSGEFPCEITQHDQILIHARHIEHSRMDRDDKDRRREKACECPEAKIRWRVEDRHIEVFSHLIDRLFQPHEEKAEVVSIP
jgi:hypothetical protein